MFKSRIQKGEFHNSKNPLFKKLLRQFASVKTSAFASACWKKRKRFGIWDGQIKLFLDFVNLKMHCGIIDTLWLGRNPTRFA